MLVELEDSDWGSDVEVEVNSKLPVEDSLSVTSAQATSPTLISDPHNDIEVYAENARSFKVIKILALPSLFNMKEGLSRVSSV